jgi:hypothetical protein
MTYSSDEEELVKRIQKLPKIPMTRESSTRILSEIQQKYPSIKRQEQYRKIAQTSSIAVVVSACVLGFIGLYHFPKNDYGKSMHQTIVDVQPPVKESALTTPNPASRQTGNSHRETPSHATQTSREHSQPPMDSVDTDQLVEAQYEGGGQVQVRVFSDSKQKVFIQEGEQRSLLHETAYPLAGPVQVHPNPDYPSRYFIRLQERKGNKTIPHLLFAEGDKVIAEVKDIRQPNIDSFQLDWSPKGTKALLILGISNPKKIVVGVVDQRDFRFVPLFSDQSKPYLLGWKDESRYLLYEDSFIEIQVDQRTNRTLAVSLPDTRGKITNVVAVRGTEPTAIFHVAMPSGASEMYQFHLKTGEFSQIGYTDAITAISRTTLGTMPSQKQLVAEVRETSLQFVVYDPVTKSSEIKLTKRFPEQKVQLDVPVLSPDGNYVAIQGLMSSSQERFLLIFSLHDGMVVYEDTLQRKPPPALKWIDSATLQVGNKNVNLKENEQ